MAQCPACKATVGIKRLRCPECSHDRDPGPEAEDQVDGELKGWAAVYAPRKPVRNAERMAAQLQQFAAGNFTGAAAGPWRPGGLACIWKRGGWR